MGLQNGEDLFSKIKMMIFIWEPLHTYTWLNSPIYEKYYALYVVYKI